MSTTPPRIDYTARDFDTNFQALVSFARARYPEKWNSFYEGDLGVALLELIAYDNSILSYLLDAQTQEIFLDTLKLRESVKHHERQTGYRLRRATAASVEVLAQVTSAPPTSSQGFRINAAVSPTVQSKDGQVWEVFGNYTVQAGDYWPTRITLEIGRAHV